MRRRGPAAYGLPASTAHLASLGDPRVVERSRGTAHPQTTGVRTRVAPTSLLAPPARRQPVARRS